MTTLRETVAMTGTVPHIEFRLGNLIESGCDAIVNAANSALAAGGGVCGAIFRAAGHDELSVACRTLGGCPTGEAKHTASYGISKQGTRFIVHAVGPDCNGRSVDDCAPELASAYRSALAVAEQIEATSIAFPSISTGIYGFPYERAAEIAAEVVTSHRGALRAIVLMDQDAAKLECYREAVERRLAAQN